MFGAAAKGNAGLTADQRFELAKLRIEAKRPNLAIGKLAAANNAVVDATDSEGRSKLMAALPWVLGGIGAAVVVAMLMRKRSAPQ